MRTLGRGREEESRGQVGHNKETGNEGLHMDLFKEMDDDRAEQVNRV